ncbi:hypothetical protein Bca101_057870 [Brassica carinata]
MRELPAVTDLVNLNAYRDAAHTEVVECAEHVATEKNEATIELNAAKNKLDVLSNDVEVSKKVVTMLAAEKEDLEIANDKILLLSQATWIKKFLENLAAQGLEILKAVMDKLITDEAKFKKEINESSEVQVLSIQVHDQDLDPEINADLRYVKEYNQFRFPREEGDSENPNDYKIDDQEANQVPD